MKNVIIHWDKTIFDGEKKLLPNVNKLYSQIYSQDKLNSWSLVFDFDESPRIQGYTSSGKVSFLIKDAPEGILVDDYSFDFFDGAKKIGTFKTVEEKKIDFNEIVTRVNIIEEEKSALKLYIKSVRNKKFMFEDIELKKILLLSNTYPFIFSLILDLNQVLAFEYLEKYFLSYPLENNAVYESNLSLFLFDIKGKIGEMDFKNYVSNLSGDITNHKIFQKSLEEIS